MDPDRPFLVLSVVSGPSPDFLATLQSLPGCVIPSLPPPASDSRLSAIEEFLSSVAAPPSRFSEDLAYVVVLTDFPAHPRNLAAISFPLDCLFFAEGPRPRWSDFLPYRTIAADLPSPAEFARAVDRVRDIQNRFRPSSVVEVPSLRSFDGTADLSVLIDYLLDDSAELIQGIYLQLKQGAWARIPVPTRRADEVDAILDAFAMEMDRRTVSRPPIQTIVGPDFVSLQVTNLFRYVYPAMSWQATPELAVRALVTLQCFTDTSLFYAFSIFQFKKLAQALDKWDVNVPPDFFDWTKWTFARQPEGLTNALLEDSIVECYHDEAIGVSWMLTCPFVFNVPGRPVPAVRLPKCYRNVNDFPTFSELRFASEVTEDAQKSVFDQRLWFEKSEKTEETDQVFNVSARLKDSEDWQSPYMCPDGVRVFFGRQADGTFKYRVSIPQVADLYMTGDAVVLSIVDMFRIFFGPGEDVTIQLWGQSLFFDGRRLSLNSSASRPRVVGTDGTFCMERSGTLFLIEKDGTFSKRQRGEWRRFDKEGTTLEGGVRREHELIFQHNPVTKERRMIRQDHIEYTILEDGRRVIDHREDFSIVQCAESVTIEIPGFPVVTWTTHDAALSFRLGSTQFTYGRTVRIVDDKFELSFTGGRVALTVRDKSLRCSPDEITVRGAGYTVIGNRQGIQRFELSKKFSPRDAFGQFPPRLFAIRGAMSLLEFVRKDGKAFEDAEIRMTRVNEQPKLRVATVTFKSADKTPAVFVEFPEVSAQAVEMLVEELEEMIAASTEAPEAEDAKAAKAAFTEVIAMLEDTIRGRLVQGTGGGLPVRSATIRRGRRPTRRSPPVVICPRRLEAQFFKADPTVRALGPGQVINFWKCHEADFSVTDPDDS
jgi:hypothetical protein